MPTSAADSSAFFGGLKARLQKQLCQEKIYITKESSKQELLSFDEFLTEVGIDPAVHGDALAKRNLATRMASRADFVLQRLGYETITLRRDLTARTILWERRICGLTIRSVFPDPYPSDILLVAADQIERLATILGSGVSFAVVGHYEYQFFAIDKYPFRPLVRSTLDPKPEFRIITYLAPDGARLTVQTFVEHFTMSIAANVLALRDHGFLPSEIKITVGSDGSLQIGESELGHQLLICPASIPDKPVQEEILRCVGEVCKQLEMDTLDPMSVLQAKAMNAYVLKRAFMKQYLKK